MALNKMILICGPVKDNCDNLKQSLQSQFQSQFQSIDANLDIVINSQHCIAGQQLVSALSACDLLLLCIPMEWIPEQNFSLESIKQRINLYLESINGAIDYRAQVILIQDNFDKHFLSRQPNSRLTYEQDVIVPLAIQKNIKAIFELGDVVNTDPQVSNMANLTQYISDKLSVAGSACLNDDLRYYCYVTTNYGVPVKTYSRMTKQLTSHSNDPRVVSYSNDPRVVSPRPDDARSVSPSVQSLQQQTTHSIEQTPLAQSDPVLHQRTHQQPMPQLSSSSSQPIRLSVKIYHSHQHQ